MKWFHNHPKFQKLFILLSFLCILPFWLTLHLHGTENLHPVIWVLLLIGIIFLILDRIFKPWEQKQSRQHK